ncbi:unnamed protein product [Camellia sinensis]
MNFLPLAEKLPSPIGLLPTVGLLPKLELLSPSREMQLSIGDSGTELEGNSLTMTTRTALNSVYDHILGLPCKGSIINVNGDHTDIEELSNMYGVKKCGSISLSSLRNELSNMQVDEDDFKGRFVLYILGSLLCPTSELSINRFDGVQKYKDKGEGKGQREIRGCLFFLMLFYVEHVTPNVDFVSPCASRQAPQYIGQIRVGFIVEDNDVSVEPNMDARLSNVEKEVKDLRGGLNNLVVGVSQSIESAKEEILIAIAKVANESWAIEKEKHSHDIDCQLKNKDILDDKWSPPPYAFQDRKFPMDKQLKQENEGLPKTPLCDQFTSSVSPFAPLFSEHELLPPKLPKVILKRSIPVDDGAESSTVLPYHMKLRRESKRKKSKHILSPYDVELGKEATMKNKQVVVFLEQHSIKIITLVALQFTLKQKDCIPDAKYPAWVG